MEDVSWCSTFTLSFTTYSRRTWLPICARRGAGWWNPGYTRAQCTQCASKRMVRSSRRIHKGRWAWYCPTERTRCTPTWSCPDMHARTPRICRNRKEKSEGLEEANAMLAVGTAWIQSCEDEISECMKVTWWTIQGTKPSECNNCWWVRIEWRRQAACCANKVACKARSSGLVSLRRGPSGPSFCAALTTWCSCPSFFLVGTLSKEEGSSMKYMEKNKEKKLLCSFFRKNCVSHSDVDSGDLSENR